MFKRTFNRLKINIILVKNLLYKEDCYGDCIYDDSSYRPREFTIQIDPCRRLDKIISTLAHELTHCAQFSTGQYKVFDRCLSPNDDGIHRWKSRCINTNTVDYYDLPWERHAFRMEDKLYKIYEKTKYYRKRHHRLPSLIKRKLS